MTLTPTVCLLALLGLVACEVFLDERFNDGEAWTERWTKSKHDEGKNLGDMKLSHGKFYGDSEADKGLQTSPDARFFEYYRKFDKTCSNVEKPLIIQYTVKHEQGIDCGGGYLKILSAATLEKVDEKKDLHGETPYQIMFGPDICGYSTKKVHVILNPDEAKDVEGKNHENKKDIKCKEDELTHLYTLVIQPDNTYEVKIDNEKVESGSLEEDWGIVKPKKIKDPKAKKPEDWEDKEFIGDVKDEKPEDWDQPEHIPDPNAKTPEDWDKEMDGEWEPPMIDNPKFKGVWKPRQIKNENYKGPWEQPEIDNPEYKPMPGLYKFTDMNAVAFDLWQVKSGTIFDNILVTDDISTAEKHAKDTYEMTKEPEKKMHEKQKEAEEAKRKEEEAKQKETEDSEKKDKKTEDEDEDLEDKEEEKKEKDEL